MAAKIDEQKCTGCGLCVETCPQEAISVEERAKVDVDRCTGCGACVEDCPNQAISVSE